MSLAEVLHEGLPADGTRSLTERQRYNLSAAAVAAQQSASTGHGDAWITVAVDRDPDRVWGNGRLWRSDGCVETLRTHNEYQWVLHLGGAPHVSRCIHPVERLCLQGFAPELASHFSTKAQLLWSAGNAFSVPVVTAVAAQCLRLLVRQGVFGDFAVPRPLADAAEAERKRRHAQITWLRREIALLEAESRCIRRRLL